jgi:hypothetical protein
MLAKLMIPEFAVISLYFSSAIYWRKSWTEGI